MKFIILENENFRRRQFQGMKILGHQNSRSTSLPPLLGLLLRVIKVALKWLIDSNQTRPRLCALRLPYVKPGPLQRNIVLSERLELWKDEFCVGWLEVALLSCIISNLEFQSSKFGKMKFTFHAILETEFTFLQFSGQKFSGMEITSMQFTLNWAGVQTIFWSVHKVTYFQNATVVYWIQISAWFLVSSKAGNFELLPLHFNGMSLYRDLMYGHGW